MRDLLRRLSEVEPTELPVLTVYLDMRPEADGQRPGQRDGQIVLRDRLRDIERTVGAHGPAAESFTADSQRIRDYAEREFDRSNSGLAIFACSGTGLWEVVETGQPFENEVAVGRVPQLFQLARLLDDHETAVIAVVDSNTARLFVSRRGRLDEVDGPDEDPIHHRRPSTGGWSEARYQRHIDKHDADFAREAASAIERLVQRTDARRVVLAGDTPSTTLLLDALPQEVRDRVGDVTQIEVRADRNEVDAEVRPILERLEAESGQSAADQVVAQVAADGLGVAGLEPTQRALEQGQVMQLVLGSNGELDDETRNDLIRAAATSAAEVEVVEEHEGLQRLGGVGALLRFKID